MCNSEETLCRYSTLNFFGLEALTPFSFDPHSDNGVLLHSIGLAKCIIKYVVSFTVD